VPTALVTGASSGIGAELARLLARDGYDLVLVARTGVKLAELATEVREQHRVSARVLPTDLADRAAPAALAAKLEQDRVEIDVLVNCAGFGGHGRFGERSLAQELEMIQVNVVALTELTHRLLPGMLARGRGRILNVASTAAFQPGPFQAVYYATKAYVLYLSEAIAEELEGTGVTVTALCPGPTETGFAARAAVTRTKLFRESRSMQAGVVAEAGYSALMRGDRVVVPGLRNKLSSVVVRLAPRRMVARTVRRMQAPG
jgi:short-subunit dehydrogenase